MLRNWIPLLLLVSPLAFVPPAQAGFSFCNFLFKITSSKVQLARYPWRVDLRPQCKVLSQGRVPSCWLHSAMQPVVLLLRQQGVLGESEWLSADFYFAKFLQKGISNHKDLKSMLDLPIFSGGVANNLIALVEEYGIVLEDQYSFPSFEGQSLKTIPYRTYSNLGLSPQDFSLRYLNTEGVVGRALPPNLPFFSTVTMNGSGRRSDEVLDQLQAELNRGLPVSVSWKISSFVYGTLRRNAGPGLRLPFIRPTKEADHEMSVVGYLPRPDGQIDKMILLNSWGDTFGERGYVLIDRAFFKKYAYQLSISNQGRYRD
jgi:hypothetical protein